MLELSRTQGQSILLFPSAEVPDDMTVKELFAAGPVEIKVVSARKGQGVLRSKIGIEAPKALTILRDELYGDGQG